MLFSSIPFLYYFLPAVIFLYFIVPFKFKNFILMLVSLFFYAWGEPIYVFLMIGVSLIGYIFGFLIDKYRENKSLSKLFMFVSLVGSFSILAIFKYTDFFIESVNTIIHTIRFFDIYEFLYSKTIEIPLPISNYIEPLKLALPIGISFYTFQIASYTIDLYWGNIKLQKSFVKFMTYVSMFPQLIAGPIVRYSDIEKEIDDRKITREDISYGVRRFVLGLSKKILLANVLGEFVDIFKTSTEKSVLFVWLYVIAYSLHIYFDFSGYSDMAIGLGKSFGFSFPENFNYPYISKSVTEFWRRWHLTLSTWFRDYIYIPLGGNRVSKTKWYRNIFVVWAFTGLWHGASWNFVIWGLMFAIILVFEKVFFGKLLEKMPTILRRIYTLLIIFISWTVFDATSMSQIGENLGMMFGFKDVPLVTAQTLYYLKSYLIVFAIGIIGATPLPSMLVKKLSDKEKWHKFVNLAEAITLPILLVVSTAYLVDGSFNPFLYFRF